MTRRLTGTSCFLALAVMTAPALAEAAPQSLVSGQTLTLELTDAANAPALTFLISKAVLKSSLYQSTAPVKGETRAERRARGDEVVLDNIEGRNLVAFARYAADELRNHFAPQGRPVAVTAAFDEGLRVNTNSLLGDSVKAGLTLGLFMPTTTPMFFNSHMELAIDDGSGAARTLTCDGQGSGRPPRTPSKKDSHGHDELDRMQDEGRKACFTQILAQLTGAAPPAAAVSDPAALIQVSAPAGGEAAHR